MKKIANLKINNVAIERVETGDFLGVTLNQHMNRGSHLNILSSTIACSKGIPNRLKLFITLLVKLTIYVLIYSNFKQGILAWGNDCKKILHFRSNASEQ